MAHTPYVVFTNGDVKHWRFRFSNGYDASVTRGSGSYGESDGLYELAVMRNGAIDRTTPITDDVLGWLEWPEVETLLDRIAAL